MPRCALQAGADWAMTCVDPLVAVDAVRSSLDNGGLRRESLVVSASRVLALKQRLGLLAVPVSTSPPRGVLRAALVSDGVVRLTGQAGDPDTPGQARVQAVADGAVVQDLSVPRSGSFGLTVPVGTWSQVCVRALNTGPGRSTPLGCARAPAQVSGAGPGSHGASS